MKGIVLYCIEYGPPPSPENKEVLCFTSSVSSTRSFDWNLESINICTKCQFIWSGKVYIWLPVWEFKKLCLWQPCVNKVMHVDRELKYWSPSTLLGGHFIQIHSCMSICFSCMYTNNYKHFHKSPIFFYYNHTCRRVKWGEHGSYETLAILP